MGKRRHCIEIDEHLLAAAMRASGLRSKIATVEYALNLFVRLHEEEVRSRMRAA
jgi:Arc/MetJ family transcription regulator